MMGLSHFNTSLVTPNSPHPFLVNYSHLNLQDLSLLPPFSSPWACSSLGCTHLQHTHLLDDSNLLLERRVTESMPACEQPPPLFTRYPEKRKSRSLSLPLFCLSAILFWIFFNAISDPSFTPYSVLLPFQFNRHLSIPGSLPDTC